MLSLCRLPKKGSSVSSESRWDKECTQTNQACRLNYSSRQTEQIGKTIRSIYRRLLEYDVRQSAVQNPTKDFRCSACINDKARIIREDANSNSHDEKNRDTAVLA